MKKSTDPRQVAVWVERGAVQQCFSTSNLNFLLYEYEKGEHITSPAQPLEEVLFVVEGTVRIYGLNNKGTLLPINQQTAPCLLGDMEFVSKKNPPFFTEAVTKVICIALPVQPYETQLYKDVRFLHTLLQSYTEKLQLFAFLNALAETVEDRVLLYLRDICPDHQLKGIEGAVLQLRCSRRQLQRVLKKLCGEGKLVKLGKGSYRLASPPKDGESSLQKTRSSL